MESSLIQDFFRRQEIHELVGYMGENKVRLLGAEGEYIAGGEPASVHEHEVLLDGRRAAVVLGDKEAATLAMVLSILIKREAEKVALAAMANDKSCEIAMLHGLSERLAATMELDEVAMLILEEVEKKFASEIAAIYLRNDNEQTFDLLANTSETAPPHVDLWLRDSMKEPGVSFCRDAVEGEYQELLSMGCGEILSVMYAPFKVNEQPLGVIACFSVEAERYGEEDLAMLGMIASYVGPPVQSSYQYEKLSNILRTIEEVNHFNDVDTILDKILYEARRIAHADAGSIFLVDGDKLTFSYVHNDTLFTGSMAQQATYKSFSVPISESSIVGYAALTGETVVIDDAYNLPPELPYSFNSSYDKQSGYKTTSILTIPMKTQQNRLIGVMQILNAKGEHGEHVPFAKESKTYAPLFAGNAAVALERGIMTRDRVLRMMKLAELRDPKETGAHVQRVGGYSGEIYQRWAKNRGVPSAEIRRERDLLRLASMLHDVGKVGIADAILKKPAKLDEDEFRTMKWHTIYGGRLFHDSSSALDNMCYDIAMHHHERWSGGGYPGVVDDIMADSYPMDTPMKGEEIPLAARIVALADVFDALCSRRTYKDPWPDEKVLSIIKEESGKHFDPSVVEAFFQIYDVILAIRKRFKEE